MAVLLYMCVNNNSAVGWDVSDGPFDAADGFSIDKNVLARMNMHI